ncbi:hypothetical protein [Pseudomonas abietaniphila]|uniref:Uncharacterized protein n=1 Tax=Pseudomonas abietaniphila TaxID=89065 RepID=A0A1G8QZJ8_9PSED|nr:hypothetical protein [Pseudomonas abietaniphila]SDJ10043.1 hypothetical protein SAMN05216605_121112 [Pseudomonas abietaniphila]
MNTTTQKKMPVAEFRRECDRLLRKVGDFHACCSADELAHWKIMSLRVIEEVEKMTCARATALDLETRAQAIVSVRKYLDAADQRIDEYNARSAKKAEAPPRIRSALRLIQGGKLH